MNLAFDIGTYQDRVAAVREALTEHGLDAVIVTLPDAIHWLTGFDTIGYLWSQSVVIDRAAGEPVLHTRTTEEPGVRQTSWLRDAVFYDIADVDPTEVLADTVRERGHGAGRVGIDMGSFTLLPVQWDRLRELLPEVDFVDTTAVIADLRLVKSPLELHYQRQAAVMADRAMLATLEALRPGISEAELAGIASSALGAAGSEFPAIPPMVVSGERSALVHGMASTRVLCPGDVVCLELGASVRRYHAIVMRTAVIGAASQRVKDVVACVAAGFGAALSAAGPGAAPNEPDDACNAELARLDLVRRRCHRIGYSIGIAYPPGWLEPMMLVAGDEHTLAAGMSFSLEPNLSLPEEGFGVKLGETVECTEDGARRLSSLDLGPFEL